MSLVTVCLFCWLGSTYRWDHMVFVFTAWLISLSIILSSSIHAVMKGSISFYFLLCSIHCVNVPHFVIHSFTDGHLGCFQDLAFVNCAAMNIGAHRFFWTGVWNFLRKLKMELPFDPAIPMLGLYPTNPETPIQKNLCTPMFIAGQFTIAKC